MFGNQPQPSAVHTAASQEQRSRIILLRLLLRVAGTAEESLPDSARLLIPTPLR